MSKKIIIIFNANSGQNQSGGFNADRLLALFKKFAIEVSLVEVNADCFAVQIEKAIAAMPDIIVAAGGDGTVSAVASYLFKSNIALGVLPLGTLNHFAKDLGLPQSIEECVAGIVQGIKSQVDMAEVNGKYFINNSAVGLYPHLVTEREQHMPKVRHKGLAMMIAACKLWLKFPLMTIEIRVNHKNMRLVTPLIFIGNNHYRPDADFGRDSLNKGLLCVYILKCTSRLAVSKLLWQALRKGFYTAEDLETYHVETLSLHRPKKQIKVSRDGEAGYCDLPLQYIIHKRALTVIRPAQ